MNAFNMRAGEFIKIEGVCTISYSRIKHYPHHIVETIIEPGICHYVRSKLISCPVPACSNAAEIEFSDLPHIVLLDCIDDIIGSCLPCITSPVSVLKLEKHLIAGFAVNHD